MRKFLPVSAALVLITVAAAGAAGPELKTDDQKTLYALGLVISQNLASFNLNATELDAVMAGISDGVLKKEYKVDVQTYGPKITALQTARASALASVEKKTAQAYLDKAAAEKGATKTASGLVITTIKPGTGASPKATDRVKVHYHGTLIDGSVFDSSVDRGEPISFPLNGVIPGWTEGLQLMKEGDKFQFVIPGKLAYGEQSPSPKIGPNSTLIFDVELLAVEVKK